MAASNSSSRNRPPRILLITYRFPPQGGGGVQRPAKMVRAWHRLGASVSVISCDSGFNPLTDATLLEDVPSGVQRINVSDHSPWLSVARIRRHLPSGVMGRILGRILTAIAFGVRFLSVPDVASFWAVGAIRAGVRVGRDRDIDAVFVTGPPFTPFVAGAVIAKRLGKPLILDYRDPWTASYLPPGARGLGRWINPWLERRILSRAAAVISAHRAIFRCLSPLLPARPPARLWVPNGYDPADFAEPGSPSEELFSLSYSGVFYDFRNPRALFTAIEDLLEAGVLDPAKFRLRTAGRPEQVRKFLSPNSRINSVLESHGYLPHRETVARLQQSTVNLVIEGDVGGANRHSPGKLYEVLYAARPVLLLCPEGISTLLARRAGGVTIVHPNDHEAIRQAIKGLYERWTSGAELSRPERGRIGFYERDYQAKRALEFISRVID